MNIKEKRLAKGLLQSEVMKDTGLYSKIENGKALACPEDTERMAVLFSCSPKELFTNEEEAFFGSTFGSIKLLSDKKKTENKAVCKSQKLRKCFWMDRNTNSILSSAIKVLGYATVQSWFDVVVDETISTAFPEIEAEYVNSDYMGREVCK